MWAQLTISGHFLQLLHRALIQCRSTASRDRTSASFSGRGKSRSWLNMEARQAILSDCGASTCFAGASRSRAALAAASAITCASSANLNNMAPPGTLGGHLILATRERQAYSPIHLARLLRRHVLRSAKIGHSERSAPNGGTEAHPSTSSHIGAQR